jgi:hypothetical protein
MNTHKYVYLYVYTERERGRERERAEYRTNRKVNTNLKNGVEINIK